VDVRFVNQAWFDDFLENPASYRAAECFWRDLHHDLIASLGIEDDWHQWETRVHVDGTPLPSDGNPIWHLKSDSLDRGYRVIQRPPSDARPPWVTAWIDEHRETIYEGTGFPADDLTVELVLTEPTAERARELLAHWLRGGTSANEMRALIEERLREPGY
jgi:hypothetical protein